MNWIRKKSSQEFMKSINDWLAKVGVDKKSAQEPEASPDCSDAPTIMARPDWDEMLKQSCKHEWDSLFMCKKCRCPIEKTDALGK